MDPEKTCLEAYERWAPSYDAIDNPLIAQAGVVLAQHLASFAGQRVLVIELHPELHDRGIGANFEVDGREVRLPSFRHDGDELARGCADAGLLVSSIVDHTPAPAALARSAKLARYAGSPVLLEVVAVA